MVLIAGATADPNGAYNAGRNAAIGGHRDAPPVKLDWQHKPWRLAGYHDVELERKYRRESAKCNSQ